MDNIIELENVTKTYGEITAADNVSLAVKRGEFVTILGPSGCGKTTLLRMIAGFEAPTSGKIFIEGRDMTDVPPDRRPVKTVHQKYALFPHLTPFDNIAFGLKLLKVPNGEKIRNGTVKSLFRKLSKAEIREKTERALDVVGLSRFADSNVVTLSGGQQQRVAIARAIVLEPKVLLLDEPLSALDLNLRKEMQLELKRLHGQLGITFVCVTHDREEAFTMSDEIVVMKDGVIRQTGAPKDVYDKPIDAFVADFVGEASILTGIMTGEREVSCLGRKLECDGGSAGKEVDVVIRPEQVRVVDGSPDGTVISSTYKGTYYETKIDIGGATLIARCDVGRLPGAKVRAEIDGVVHVMEK